MNIDDDTAELLLVSLETLSGTLPLGMASEGCAPISAGAGWSADCADFRWISLGGGAEICGHAWSSAAVWTHQCWFF